MEFLVANLSSRPRRERLHGREYLVAPMTLIVPGVLPGSRGALYYPPEEVAQNFGSWDFMPIVVEHPTDGSARRPQYIDRQGIGHVFNTVWDTTRKTLRAEGWFDVERVRTVSPDTLQAIQNGMKVELSTGLALDMDAKPGVFNDREYVAVARRYRPDHIAILPNGRGACSVLDGCGVNNARGSYKGVWRTLDSGAKIFIEDGVITKGPKQFRGKKPSEIKPKKKKGPVARANEAAEASDKPKPKDNAGESKSKGSGKYEDRVYTEKELDDLYDKQIAPIQKIPREQRTPEQEELLKEHNRKRLESNQAILEEGRRLRQEASADKQPKAKPQTAAQPQAKPTQETTSQSSTGDFEVTPVPKDQEAGESTAPGGKSIYDHIADGNTTKSREEQISGPKPQPSSSSGGDSSPSSDNRPLGEKIKNPKGRPTADQIDKDLKERGVSEEDRKAVRRHYERQLKKEAEAGERKPSKWESMARGLMDTATDNPAPQPRQQQPAARPVRPRGTAGGGLGGAGGIGAGGPAGAKPGVSRGRQGMGGVGAKGNPKPSQQQAQGQQGAKPAPRQLTPEQQAKLEQLRKQQEQAMLQKQGQGVANADKSEGVWRTIRGAKVFIEGGKITKGPKALRGKSQEAAEKKAGKPPTLKSKRIGRTQYHYDPSKNLVGEIKGPYRPGNVWKLEVGETSEQFVEAWESDKLDVVSRGKVDAESDRLFSAMTMGQTKDIDPDLLAGSMETVGYEYKTKAAATQAMYDYMSSYTPQDKPKLSKPKSKKQDSDSESAAKLSKALGVDISADQVKKWRTTDTSKPKSSKVGGKMKASERVAKMSDSAATSLAKKAKGKSVYISDIHKAVTKAKIAGTTAKQQKDAVQAAAKKLVQRGVKVTGVSLADIEKWKSERTDNQLTPAQENLMCKQTLIDELVDVSNGLWTEADREQLDAFSESKLQQLVANAFMQGAQSGDGEDDEEDMDEEEQEMPGKMAKNSITFNDLPKDLQEDITFARNAKQKHKEALVDKLVVNRKECERAKVRTGLLKKSIAELEEMVSFLPQQTYNQFDVQLEDYDRSRLDFSGAAVGNSRPQPYKPVPLGQPVMDFSSHKLN